jgi:hypothetical protein
MTRTGFPGGGVGGTGSVGESGERNVHSKLRGFGHMMKIHGADSVGQQRERPYGIFHQGTHQRENLRRRLWPGGFLHGRHGIGEGSCCKRWVGWSFPDAPGEAKPSVTNFSKS